MHRPKYAIGFLLAPIVFTVTLLAAGCGGGYAEKPVLDKFFQASKMRDTVTMNNIAMVDFNKNDQGVVENFSVVSVSEPTVAPLHLKELAKAHDEARRASDDLNKRKLAYQDEHADELKRLLDAEKKGLKLKGKDAEFQASWNKWREETTTVEKNLSEARQKLNAERAIAEVSVMNQQNPVDLAQYDGKLATKDITVSAEVITPEGQHVTKTLVISMAQARLEGATPITGKWIITKIKDAGTGATNP